MGIQFRKEEQEFHLFNEEMSYIFSVLPNGHLSQLYYGPRVSTEQSYSYLIQGGQRSLTSYIEGYENDLSLQHLRQEYACYGTGDVLSPAFEIAQEDGSRLSHFKYQEYRVVSGKSSLTGLPATYSTTDYPAETLIVELFDDVTQTVLELHYSIFSSLPVLARHAVFRQVGEQSITLERALSLNLDLPDKDYEWIHLDGAWSRERHIQTSPLHQGVQSIYSLKGTSSSEHNPFMALKRPQTDEHQGEVIGISLVYSGNFLAQVDVTPYEQVRASIGIHPDRFSWSLSQGQEFVTPEALLVYSQKGLNGLSHAFHSLFNHCLVRGEWKGKERPVLINNWEATYFDFTEEKILELAKEAAALGVELFVLDDGWFGERYNDQAGLGDWQVNPHKLPNGLPSLIQNIHGLGMKFGIWIEPEMVNKDSNLYRQHPDWHFHHPKRFQSPSRYQYVLNFAEDAVFENIYQQLYQLLSSHDIDYVKWDMNRYLTEVFSVHHQAENQGELFHRYVLNVYRLYDRLTQDFPQILFESCSSGGARFDPGLLYYAPQTWTSDNTDAIERLSIQYGTSVLYPLSSMGSHVSAVPNHQVSRITSLTTRGHVSHFGSMGYELNLLQLSEEERQQVKEQINFYKKHRATFQYGEFTRLLSPFEQDIVAWQVKSADTNTVLIGYYRKLIQANEGFKRIYPKHLDEEAIYEYKGQSFRGSSLMRAGLVVEPQDFEAGFADFASLLIELKKR